MANIPTVFLKLQHGDHYTDGPSGVTFTRGAPVQPVPEARARELLRELVPLYLPNGENKGNARRFIVTKAPAPKAAEDPLPEPIDDTTEPSAEEIESEIAAAALTSPASEKADVPPATPPRPVRQRLPRTEGDGSGS